MSRFMDPTTDFGFKKLFGEEANKDIIMSFLPDVLEYEVPLLEIEFLDKEQLPDSKEERVGIFDLHCRDVEGNHFIVEMQKNRFAFVRDRMVYYSTFPIVGQAKKGRQALSYFDTGEEISWIRDGEELTYANKHVLPAWDYRLSAIYCIAILGYVLDGSKTAVNRNSLRNDEPPHELFYDKLRFVTVELPLFDERQPEYDSSRHLNKWLYFLKYLAELDDIPEVFKDDPVFLQAFRVAELANLAPMERRLYEQSLKRFRDTYAVLNAKLEEGRTEGEAAGKIKGKKEYLISFLIQKLGAMPSEIADAIRALNDEKQVDFIQSHFDEIGDWQTLRDYLHSMK